ncbi:MAG: hypothetical protein GWO20_13860, partial [Candidatus Korarchaeota archaeon]|nr:hypothetical protein [Candidatus Korarchaeota archaeon]NIU84502.1 hypothetical protein [Candidatus Thorarchaeota archaeon]NIW14569.1 hypothetical protein [Candidatus Thorarchaeota archaeon]NIW52641.1 hypothetical protein [Candidatus Korarchaeota archaeon]
MSAKEVLISFDIDGTLKGYGGPITTKHIKKAKENTIVGGGSSRSVRSQWIVWQELGIKPEFLVFKNNLPRLPERYPEIKKFF